MMHDHYIHLIVCFCSGYIETKPERYQNRLVIPLNIFSPFDITPMFLVIIRSQSWAGQTTVVSLSSDDAKMCTGTACYISQRPNQIQRTNSVVVYFTVW